MVSGLIRLPLGVGYTCAFKSSASSEIVAHCNAGQVMIRGYKHVPVVQLAAITDNTYFSLSYSSVTHVRINTHDITGTRLDTDIDLPHIQKNAE